VSCYDGEDTATAYSPWCRIENTAPVITQGASSSLLFPEDGPPDSITLDATDVDGDPLTWSITTDATKGAATLSGATATYTPSADEAGETALS
jgi:hypothetical protein